LLLSRVPFPAAMITMANCIVYPPFNASLAVSNLKCKLKFRPPQ
jgi:hypothetical protein